jgi:sulfur carrier protein ThiS
MEQWRPIKGFAKYSVSNYGRFRKEKTGHILVVSLNQYGVACVGLMRDGIQFHRSVPKLVADAFIPSLRGPFDTPINLDGDRLNNHVDNLAWRPRWFAVKYNRQFRDRSEWTIDLPIVDVATGEETENSWETAKRYGLLEEDVVLSIANNTIVWPTHQTFRVVD